MPITLEASTLTPGDVVGGYRLIRPLGRGGFGEVFEARHPGEDRLVAIKVLTRYEAAGAGFVQRFRDEARLLSRIDSPHVVRIYAVGELPGGAPYIVMEHFADGALSYLLKRGPLPLERAVKIMGDLLVALDAAHRQGVIHRDVKSSNVLIDVAGDRAALCDFGIARSAIPMEGEAPATGRSVLGTPHYTPPERLLRARDGSTRREDPRSDLYSAGVIFYRMLAGQRPFEAHSGDALAVARAVLMGDVPPLPEMVPPEMQAVCMQLLARTPDGRYASAREALKALARTWARVSRTEVMQRAPIPEEGHSMQIADTTPSPPPGLSAGLPAAWLYTREEAPTVRTPTPVELLQVDEPSSSPTRQSKAASWWPVVILTGLLLVATLIARWRAPDL
ncbi:MAG: serine/threonine-protein kinase [Bradymonadia bacterium]